MPRGIHLSVAFRFQSRSCRKPPGAQMPDTDTDRRLAELDRLLNDPEVRLDAERVWALLAEIALRIPAPRVAQSA
jgi:hypothetical protein